MKVVYIFCFCFYQIFLFAQDEKVRYTKDFMFKEGIYKSFEDFKTNSPPLKVKAMVKTKYDEQLLLGPSWKSQDLVYEEKGQISKIKAKDVWGYCLKGFIYIRYKKVFYRLKRIGSIMLFNEETVGGNTLLQIATGFSSTNERKNILHLVNFNDGEVYDFEPENFEELVKNDMDFYTEFRNSGNYYDKKNKMFIYLQKYNAKHPIYF